MTRLLTAMLAATQNIDVISLPGGVTWPDMGSSELYVRELYGPLWETVLERGEGRLRGAALLGTPGSKNVTLGAS